MDLSFTDIYKRMLEASDLKNGSEVARILKISPQAISNYRKKGTMPAGLAIRFAENYGLSLDWIVTGEGEKFRKNIKTSIICTMAVTGPADGKGCSNEYCADKAEYISMRPEEMIYIGKLLNVLRSSEKYAGCAIKASIDAIEMTITENRRLNSTAE